MLNFVLGRSGFGKTEYLKNYFCALSKSGYDKLLYLVPDQITFETEKTFLDALGPSLSSNILVLGFSRLSDYVFERSGNSNDVFADEGTRHVVMSVALEQVSDQLDLFKKRAGRFDLCDLMLTAVKEYKKCSISADTLFSMSEEVEDETLSKKLYESALVYQAYDAVMERSYVDPLDSLSKLCRILENDSFFEGYTIAVDSFYGFTAREYDVIEQLMIKSRDMYVALCLDAERPGSEVFAVSERTRARLRAIADSCSLSIASDIILSEPLRFEDKGLASLEENIYRLHKTPYRDQCGAITAYRAADIYDECDFVARSIRKLVMGGMRYRDIAVVSRDTNVYSGVLDTYLEKYHIGYFMDKPYHIDAFPIVRLISAVFDTINKGFDRDDILTILKTGLTSHSPVSIAEFENYLYIWDISKSRFFSPFTMHPRGFCDEFTDDDISALSSIETIRKELVSPLRDFSAKAKDTSAKGIAKALFELLYTLDCDKNIDRLCDDFEKQGRTDLAEESVRLWNVLCEAIDKMVAVVGDYSMSEQRFSELLYSYFANLEISSIPRGLDQVDVALADRALLFGKKAVFVIGAVEGEFPRIPVEAGVFTDAERVTLRSMELPLSDSVEELSATEKYFVYSAVTSASQKLFISYPASNVSGEAALPSSILSELNLSVSKYNSVEHDTLPVEEHLYTKESAFEWLVGRYSNSSDYIDSLKEYFSCDSEYAPIISAIEAARLRRPKKIRDKQLCEKLFDKRLTLSSSQVDRFHLCRFEYFCRYGLNIKERRKASIDALEYGTMVHHILESYFKAHKGDDYSKADKSELKDEISAILEKYIDKHLGGKENKSKRFLYLFERIKKASINLVSHIIDELAQSEFSPADFELSIGEDIPAYTLTLDNGRKIMIKGSVDRVDIMKKDGAEYVRVIDYKTGTKKFSLSDILYGINLQMLIYMSAISANGQQRYGAGITPAGVLYMPAVSPSVSAGFSDSAEDIEKEKMRQYRMHGIVLDDKDVIASMERDMQGVYIPVSVSNDKITGGASLATLEQLGSIFRHIDNLITDMGKALYDGEIGAVPVKGAYDACEWCQYSAVCGRRDSDGSREITNLSKEEFYRAIKEEDDREQNLDR